jgi:biopolymer transport protein TolR
MKKVKRKSIISEMNVVPYIDVMLVLLIIFMVAAPMLNQGIDVSLPNASGKDFGINKDNLPIIISLKSEADTYIDINGENMKAGINVIIERILEEKKSNPSVKVLLKAEENIEYKVVISVMDTLNKNGLSDFGLLTKKN